MDSSSSGQVGLEVPACAQVLKRECAHFNKFILFSVSLETNLTTRELSLRANSVHDSALSATFKTVCVFFSEANASKARGGYFRRDAFSTVRFIHVTAADR